MIAQASPIQTLFESVAILHVDDEPEFAALVTRILERERDDFEVTTAQSPSEGQELLATDTFDCIVSDFDFPGKDGIEFLGTVREDHPNLPFILYTGKGSEEIASKAIRAGVDDYLQKESGTSHIEVLANLIGNLVEQHRLRQAAEETEHRLQTIAENTDDVLWMFTADWEELLFINSPYEEIWGHSIDELRKRPESFLEAVHPDDRPKTIEAIERLSNGEPIDYEHRVNPSEDFNRWVWAKGEPIFDDAGEVVKVAGFVRDITDRKEREQELERTYDFFREAEQLGHLGAWEVSATGEVIWTAGTRQIHEVAEDFDPTLESGIEFYHPNDQERIQRAVEHALSNNKPYDIEARLITAKENERWVCTRGKPIENGAGIRGYIQDITVQKEREQKLQASQERFESLFDSIRDAIVVANTDREIIQCNSGFTELFGYTLDEIQGKPTTILYENLKEFEEFGQALQNHIDDPRFTETVTYETKNGNTFPGETNISAFRDSDGELIGFIGGIRDISARQERLRQIKIIDRVLRHNLNNDMNVILGHAELIQAESSGDIVTYAETIVNTGNRLLQTADKERAVTKFLAESPSAMTVDAIRLITRTVERMRVRHPDAKISMEVPDGQSVSVVDGFGAALEELIENAIIHSDRDTPSVTVTVERERDMVEIRVTDDGPGISEMDRLVLTEGEELTPLFHGSGFGLWLVHVIVRNSRGNLAVQRNDPRGNTVTVRVPAG